MTDGNLGDFSPTSQPPTRGEITLRHSGRIEDTSPDRLSMGEGMAGIDREKLRSLIDQSGKSMRAVSLQAGLGETGVKDIVRGKSKEPGVSSIARIAQVLNANVQDLLEGGGEAFRVAAGAGYAGAADHTLPVRGDVRAGQWLEVDDLDQSEPDRAPAPIDPRYPRIAQWLSRVRGDSMNDLRRDHTGIGIVEGDLVHTIDAIAISYVPVTGDVVEAERIRLDGREREVTLKQVEVKPDGEILLWPRSTNPRWAEPLRYAEGLSNSDGSEVRIRGKVLQVIRPL